MYDLYQHYYRSPFNRTILELKSGVRLERVPSQVLLLIEPYWN